MRERRPETPVYVISVAATLTGLHPRTLRIYEARGLINPARTARNIRLYSERDIQRVRIIRHLIEERGLNLAGVKLMLELQERVDYHELTWILGDEVDESLLGSDEHREHPTRKGGAGR